MNPGRIILRNVLASGFDPACVTVVKPGLESLDGVRCVPEIGALPGPVDLLVVALEAARLRTIVTAAHADEQLDIALAAFDRVGHELGLISG